MLYNVISYPSSLVVKLRQTRDASIDPMLFLLVSFQCDVHDKVAGVSRRRQHSLPLTRLVNRTEVTGRRLEISYQSRFEPNYRDSVKQDLWIGFVHLHRYSIPSCAFEE